MEKYSIRNFRKLLNRYKKAEQWFEQDIDIDLKLKYVETLNEIVNLIHWYIKDLKLTEQQVREEMLKANIEVGEG